MPKTPLSLASLAQCLYSEIFFSLCLGKMFFSVCQQVAVQPHCVSLILHISKVFVSNAEETELTAPRLPKRKDSFGGSNMCVSQTVTNLFGDFLKWQLV